LAVDAGKYGLDMYSHVDFQLLLKEYDASVRNMYVGTAQQSINKRTLGKFEIHIPDYASDPFLAQEIVDLLKEYEHNANAAKVCEQKMTNQQLLRGFFVSK